MSDDPASAPPEGEPTRPGRADVPRTLVFHALLAGVTPLVPIPLLDDAVRDRVRRRLVRDLLRARGIALDPLAERILALGVPRAFYDHGVVGCLAAALRPFAWVARKVLAKLFRKIFFVLALKDCLDTFALAFHEGFLVRHALALGAVRGPSDVIPTRQAIDRVLAAVDPRPLELAVRRTLRWGWRITGLRALLRARRGEPPPAEAGRLVDELAEDLVEAGYLRGLELRLAVALGRQDSPDGGPATPGIASETPDERADREPPEGA